LKKRYLAIAALLLVLSGCSKVTKENYDKIEVGMTYDNVVQLIGKPERCSEALGISSCEWENGDARVDIKFVSNQVTFIAANGLK
jgi:PBP1b-binding outer membrane lipoprotein LpoB